jgi:uncharacterized DUF497 family protein
MRGGSFVAFSRDDANRRKCQKHGVSIEEIEYILAHAATLIVPALTSSNPEPRFLAIGRTQDGRYTFVVFTPRSTRGDITLRPISARYMHRKEIRKYEKEIARLQDR